MSDSLKKLIADFGKMPLDLRRELRSGMKEAADPILQAIRRHASWSTRIPPATRIAVRFGAKTAGVTIRTSAKRAPHARPYEHGGVPGTFRHPVFGNRRNWVAQQARPFFYQGVFEGADGVAAKVDGIVAEVARRGGWH